MIPTEQANGLIKKLHKEMNAVGKYNTYVITEDVESGNIYMNVCTSDKKVSEEEKRSFSQLFDKIKPYIAKRTRDFKQRQCEELKQLLAPVIREVVKEEILLEKKTNPQVAHQKSGEIVNEILSRLKTALAQSFLTKDD